MAPRLVHGTAIALGARAAILRGPSGAGKSDLALRCLLHPTSALIPEAAKLISDDQVVIIRENGVLFASAPETIKGKLEVRGLGVIDLPAGALSPAAPVALIFDLVAANNIERMPNPVETVDFEGAPVPLSRLDPWELSAAGKVLLALGSGSF